MRTHRAVLTRLDSAARSEPMPPAALLAVALALLAAAACGPEPLVPDQRADGGADASVDAGDTGPEGDGGSDADRRGEDGGPADADGPGEDARDAASDALDGGACPGLPSKVDATLVLYESFDTEPFAGVKNHLYRGGSVGMTDEPTRAGPGAAVFRVGDPQLTPEECTQLRYRAEVISAPMQQYYWDDGVSYWIGVSMNPTIFAGDAFSLLQVHAPDEASGDPCDYAGNAITIIPRLEDDGQMYYRLNVIERGGRSSGTGAGSGQTTVWTEPLHEHEWVDFVINFTLSTKNAGYFHIYRNGELIYSKVGLTNVNYIDSCGNPIPADLHRHNGPHIGIYGPPCGDAPWMQESAGPVHLREVVMDELRLATGPEGYLLVDPRQCGVLPEGFPPSD